MNQPYRISEGGRIDRSTPLSFVFNRKTYEGYSGDTLASALLANGVRITSRSFKFHRPRGVLSAGVEETNALVGVDWGRGMLPMVRATLMPLIDGLRERGFERKGETIQLFDDDKVVSARVIDTCFYDPDGERMRG